jgi:catechol 1,2-dioxygenase
VRQGIDDDSQFGITQTTLADFVRHGKPHPTAGDIKGPWYSLDYTYVLCPEARRDGSS